MPSLQLSLAFNVDGWSLLFAFLISAIGTLVAVYASAYLHAHRDAGRFYGSLFGFIGAMLGVALSDNVLALFVFWELTGFTSFLLIGFDHDRADARAAALQALIVTGAGGLALLAAGVLLTGISGTASLSAMSASGGIVTAHPLYVWAAMLTLLAAFTKSAQAPFHFWLPKAMAAPTPVSAYLHSATMVKAGVYLLARMTPILGGTALWTTVVPIVGAATMLLGAYRAIQETDLKRILAYSTVSALGLLTMLIGIGTTAAMTAMLVYLVAHAFYKGALFLVAGAIDHETGSRDITRLAGLRATMPRTTIAGGAAALSMAGVPITLGFVAKDGAYDALLASGPWAIWFAAAAVVASVLMGVAGLLAGVAPFGGPASADAGHEPEWRLLLPPIILALAGVIVGIAPMLLNAPLSVALAAIHHQAGSVSLGLWHGVSPALMLSALTLAAVAALYLQRDALRTLAWRPTFGTEQIYTGLLSGLDAISRVIAPPLHRASLRSYVMVIVLATAVAGFASIWTLPALSLTARTSIQGHEAMIVVVIIAGAIAATLAKTTMAAVLSLGVVGYGVAMTFLLYGAPDLAMTQFSVETLTVLIYVLVFRHFRKLGDLSPPLVRFRDLLIGAGTGALIGTLVLAISNSETAANLREYFVEFAPTLGHGRNIVNVILVDFRAFDTLGEITVLTTAAIGVRALLRIASSDEATPRSDAGMSPIFQTGARFLMPLLLLFALFLLWRGHNEPGGGFVGGLVAAAAYSLYLIAYGVEHARRAIPVKPVMLLGSGLLLALASGIPAALEGQPFLTAQWIANPFHAGTPMIFDVGVFLVVTGVMLMMIFTLAEEA